MSSLGVYGVVKPAYINPAEDVDIFYHYRPTRNSDETNFTEFEKMDSNLLSSVFLSDISTSLVDKTLSGIYNLKLPLNIFGKKGFYTVYIKPREIVATITDIGVLAAYPDIKGVVLDMTKITNIGDTSILNNNNLVGYRIEYFDNNKRQEYYRLITSNNKCEPVVQNLNDSNQKSVRYRYNDSSNLIFCTVSPSTATNFKANAIPFIGKTGQQIVLINTKFNPVMLEIEMTEENMDTLATRISGNQIRNLDRGLITTYNNDDEIFLQQEYGTLKDRYTGKALYDIKKKRDENIDFSQDWKDITEEF